MLFKAKGHHTPVPVAQVASPGSCQGTLTYRARRMQRRMKDASRTPCLRCILLSAGTISGSDPSRVSDWSGVKTHPMWLLPPRFHRNRMKRWPHLMCMGALSSHSHSGNSWMEPPIHLQTDANGNEGSLYTIIGLMIFFPLWFQSFWPEHGWKENTACSVFFSFTLRSNYWSRQKQTEVHYSLRASHRRLKQTIRGSPKGAEQNC